MPPHNFAQRGLGYLVYRCGDVLNGDDSLNRINHSVVGHRGHINTHVVLRNDALRLNRHGHDSKAYHVQPIDDRDDESQPGHSDPDYSA